MFRIGQMIFDYRHKVSLPVEGKTVRFIVGNPEDIPYNLKRSVETGDRREGLFEFEPQDQFAYFIDLEKVKITREKEKAEEADPYECEEGICEHNCLGRCQGRPFVDCPE